MIESIGENDFASVTHVACKQAPLPVSTCAHLDADWAGIILLHHSHAGPSSHCTSHSCVGSGEYFRACRHIFVRSPCTSGVSPRQVTLVLEVEAMGVFDARW